MDIERLHAIGKDMGLTGSALQEWVDAERVIERDLRVQVRNEQRERIELEERRLQAEERVLQLKLKLQEQATSSNAGQSGRPVSDDAASPAVMDSCSPHKLLPPFNEMRDDLDAYLQRFERVAVSQEWPRSKWALSLSLCLTGEALSVISRLDSASASDYDQVKTTLLLRFRYTAEGYREKFRKARPEDKETGLQYASRIAGHFDRWMELANVEKTYDALRDVMIAEQFMKGCSPTLRVFLKERNCKKLNSLAQNADCFLEAQDLINLGKDKLMKESSADARKTETAKRQLKSQSLFPVQ